jgi:hypothetical protein
MKQFVQNLKIPGTMFGRFLAVAVLTATAFTFTTRAQADPGHGAVVTHTDRNLTSHYYAESPDGQLRLVVVLTGQGEFLRQNTDGTWTLQTSEPRAPITLSVRGSDDDWVPMWVGSGSFHISGLVELGDGIQTFTGEATSLHVEGKLTNVLDGSEWSFHVVAEFQDYEIKKLKIDLQPR